MALLTSVHVFLVILTCAVGAKDQSHEVDKGLRSPEEASWTGMKYTVNKAGLIDIEGGTEVFGMPVEYKFMSVEAHFIIDVLKFRMRAEGKITLAEVQLRVSEDTSCQQITRKVRETLRRTYAEDLLAVIHEQFEVYANVVSYAKPRVQFRCVSYSSLYANSRVFYAIREATYMYVRT